MKCSENCENLFLSLKKELHELKEFMKKKEINEKNKEEVEEEIRKKLNDLSYNMGGVFSNILFETYNIKDKSGKLLYSGAQIYDEDTHHWGHVGVWSGSDMPLGGILHWDKNYKGEDETHLLENITIINEK